MSSGPRVCMLLETFHPEIGGGETQARLLSGSLLERGLEVILLTRRSAAGLLPFEHVSGAPVHRLPPTGRGRLRKWGLILTALPALMRLRRGYDVVLVCGFRILGVPAVVASKLLRKPCVLKADSNGEMSGAFFAAGLARSRLSPSSLPVRAFIRTRNAILRGADAFVPLSTEIAGELRAHGVPEERIHPIPNCVDTATFRPVGSEEKRRLREELGIPASAIVFVFTGRLVTYKGLPLLLRTWDEISRRYPHARLFLVGSGGADLHNCETELKAYVASHRLEGSVRFTGAVTDVHRYLQAADAFLFPTRDEAFGIALIEAMACGLAAVTTSTGGIRDIARDRENALVVAPGDSDGLAAAVEILIADAPLRASLGAAARRTAWERYSVETVGVQYEDLLRRVTRRSAGVASAAESPGGTGGPGSRAPDPEPLPSHVSARGSPLPGLATRQPPRPVLQDLTLVIPTLGRSILETCFQRLAAGAAWPARLILVDQGSHPQVETWVGALRALGMDVEHVRAPRRGRAAGVNRGLERVRTRFCAVTDDDCFADPDWLLRMVARLRAEPGAMVTGRVEPEGEGDVVALVTSRTAATYHRPRLKHDSLSGGNMGAAMDVIARIGLFDEDPCLATAEDCEYSYRTLRSGVPIVYDPDVVVRHAAWRDAGQRAEIYRGYARSLAGFFGKYLRRGDGFIALRTALHALRSLKRWLRGALTGDAELALNGRAYLEGLLPGLLAGWRGGQRGA